MLSLSTDTRASSFAKLGMRALVQRGGPEPGGV
jgi:hypothetical protein